ncbi:hypothetical protein EDC04DRAFT_1172320 [Pisolithus marmoratus]|nr:hypothetical protein EDC04DRAFT_1172320 [Pisolithus marmoratus]
MQLCLILKGPQAGRVVSIKKCQRNSKSVVTDDVRVLIYKDNSTLAMSLMALQRPPQKKRKEKKKRKTIFGEILTTEPFNCWAAMYLDKRYCYGQVWTTLHRNSRNRVLHALLSCDDMTVSNAIHPTDLSCQHQIWVSSKVAVTLQGCWSPL